MITRADWDQLDKRTPKEAGRSRQRVHPESSRDLFISFTGRERQPSIELVVPDSVAEDVILPASTRAIVVEAEKRRDGVAMRVTLTDVRSRDIFEWLAGDLAARAAEAASDEAALDTWHGRLQKWIRLLQRVPEGLSPSRQRGLYGELYVLERLSAVLGVDAAVAAWLGPSGHPRDFEASAHSIETKTSAANEPQVARINGERQLDDQGLDLLHLVHLSVEPIQGASETLPALVARVRDLCDGGQAVGVFEERLFDAGYSLAHEERYASTGYALRRLSCFRVEDGFPRLTESGLPEGLGNVRYDLVIDACRDFEVPFETALQSMAVTRGA